MENGLLTVKNRRFKKTELTEEQITTINNLAEDHLLEYKPPKLAETCENRKGMAFRDVEEEGPDGPQTYKEQYWEWGCDHPAVKRVYGYMAHGHHDYCECCYVQTSIDSLEEYFSRYEENKTKLEELKTELKGVICPGVSE